MGVNYYIVKKNDMTVEVEHIGKYSGGWTFGFQGSKQKTIAEWQERLNNLAEDEVIRDEHHVTFTPAGFWDECVEGSKRQQFITPASFTSRGYLGKGWVENGFRFTPQEFC